jgi:hypothetical protein
MADQPLVSQIRPDTKDVRVVKVIIETAACFREHLFEDPKDPRRACHLGLKALDFAICPNCVHFGPRPPATTKMLTGGEAMAVMATLDTLKHTHNSDTGDRPEGPITLTPEASDGLR